METKAELRSLRVILRRIEQLSPATRRWLIERLRADLRAAQTVCATAPITLLCRAGVG